MIFRNKFYLRQSPLDAAQNILFRFSPLGALVVLHIISFLTIIRLSTLVINKYQIPCRICN